MFVTGFFHADPHPGNIFVTPAEPDSPVPFTLTFIDFGMMGEVSEALKQDLQTLLFAVVARDARAYVQAIQKLGILLPSADTVQLERVDDEVKAVGEVLVGIRFGLGRGLRHAVFGQGGIHGGALVAGFDRRELGRAAHAAESYRYASCAGYGAP